MTLDGAIECLRIQAKENKKSIDRMKHLEANDKEKLADWLEELKILRMMVKRSEYLEFKETIK